MIFESRRNLNNPSRKVNFHYYGSSCEVCSPIIHTCFAAVYNISCKSVSSACAFRHIVDKIRLFDRCLRHRHFAGSDTSHRTVTHSSNIYVSKKNVLMWRFITICFVRVYISYMITDVLSDGVNFQFSPRISRNQTQLLVIMLYIFEPIHLNCYCFSRDLCWVFGLPTVYN